MYILTIEETFSAAHQLAGYKGKCENLHGHNWRVELAVKGSGLNSIGILCDFHDLKALLKSALASLDHANLNEVPPFDRMNPTSENIARHIFETIEARISDLGPGLAVESATVWESDTSRCTYRPKK